MFSRAGEQEFLKLDRYDWIAHSPAISVGLWALDLVACRHFKCLFRQVAGIE